MGFNNNFVEDSVVSETGNWNVAQSYSEGIIMDQLRYIKSLQRICEVGLDEPNPEMSQIRVESLKRLVQAMKQLISDTRFALKNKTGKDKFKEHYDNLNIIRKTLNKVYEIKQNKVRKTSIFELKEDIFTKYCDNLDLIKMELYETINDSDLIYPTKEEFDPKAWKDAIMKRATTKG